MGAYSRRHGIWQCQVILIRHLICERQEHDIRKAEVKFRGIVSREPRLRPNCVHDYVSFLLRLVFCVLIIGDR